MADKTSYEVEINYRLAGVEKALGKLKEGENLANRMAKGLEWVKRAALAMGAAMVFGKMKSALIESNRELESMQIGMSAVLGMSLDMPFKKAEPIAARLVEHYRQIAKISPGTMQDFLEFNNLASGAVLGAGGTIGQLKAITEGGVIAGKSFGFRGDVAGRDVQQALTGNVSMQTPMIKMLLGSEAKIAEFNKMTGDKRVAALVKAFESPALKDAAKKFGASYEGQLSTLKDNSQSLFRTIGKPLFDQLTKWLTQINAWIDRNPARIAAFAKTVGNALADGARWLVKGVGFLVDNKGVILAIAASFAALKMANMAGTGGIVTGLVSSLGIFGLAIGAATVALWALGKIPGGKSAPQVLMEQDARIRGGASMGIKKDLNKSFGFGHEVWSVDRAAFMANTRAIQASANSINYGAALTAKITAKKEKFQAQIDGLLAKYMTKDDDLKKKDLKGKGNTGKVNVTIKRVEVVADDADRFVHKIVGAIGKEIRSPSQWAEMPRGHT